MFLMAKYPPAVINTDGPKIIFDPYFEPRICAACEQCFDTHISFRPAR
jgi:hypothetical protein